MLALNAPPGQGPAQQPFVHYRCLCCSPGTKPKSSTSSEPAETTPHETTKDKDQQQREEGREEEEEEEEGKKEKDVQQDSSTALISITKTSEASHPTDEPTTGGLPRKVMEEIFASGNTSDLHGSQPLSRLYFCDSCDEIRCSKCSQDEIVCYFCPNCLFDVPTASVKLEKHKCSRNCFECPICQNTLSVVSEDPDAGQFAAVPPAYGQFYLLCHICHWNSQSINMTFEKPTGLAAQLQKADETSPDIMEFGRLKDHLEKHFRNSAKPSSSLHSSLLSSIQTGSLRYVSSTASSTSSNIGGLSHRRGGGDDFAHYTPAVQVMDDTENLDTLMSVINLNQITTMKQRLRELHKQPYSPERLQPKRIHLRIKKSRRCRTCGHILVNPEQKAQSIRFKIKLIALNQIPNITIANVQPMIVQTLSRVILRFTNPRHEEVQVSVRYGDGAQPHHGVHIHSPTFSILPYNEVWEYEVGTIAAAPGSVQENVYEKTANSTSIVLDITPVAAGEVKIPLFVSFTFKTKVRSETGSPSLTSTQLVVSGASAKDIPASDADFVEKTVAFWTIIGFGDALPTLAT